MGMAKSFFSSLGSKDGGSRSSSAASMSSSKSGERYLSEFLDLEGSEEQPTGGYDEDFDPEVNETERPVHEIHEIDSHEVTLPTIFEEVGDNAPELVVQPPPTQPMPPLSTMPISPPAFAPAELESMVNWPPPPQLPTVSPVSWSNNQGLKMPPRPALQLHTSDLELCRPQAKRSKALAPSTSVRSTASTDTTASSDSTASYLISPMSQWSGGWAQPNGRESNLTSPDDELLPCNPFGPPSYKPVGDVSEESIDYNTSAFITSELPADMPMLDPLTTMPNPSLGSSSNFLETPALTFESTLSTNDSSFVPSLAPPLADDHLANNYPLPSTSSLQTPQTLDFLHGRADSLVTLAWKALQLHFSESMTRLEALPTNHVLSQFRSMAPDALGFMALDTLVNVLDGAVIESPVELLSFIHLAYSFFVVVHQQDAPNKDDMLFSQALAYGRHLSRGDRQAYQKIVALLWKPHDMSAVTVNQLIRKNSLAAANSPSHKGKEPQSEGGRNDSLVFIAQYFLDGMYLHSCPWLVFLRMR